MWLQGTVVHPFSWIYSISSLGHITLHSFCCIWTFELFLILGSYQWCCQEHSYICLPVEKLLLKGKLWYRFMYWRLEPLAMLRSRELTVYSGWCSSPSPAHHCVGGWGWRSRLLEIKGRRSQNFLGRIKGTTWKGTELEIKERFMLLALMSV